MGAGWISFAFCSGVGLGWIFAFDQLAETLKGFQIGDDLGEYSDRLPIDSNDHLIACEKQS